MKKAFLHQSNYSFRTFRLAQMCFLTHFCLSILVNTKINKKIFSSDLEIWSHVFSSMQDHNKIRINYAVNHILQTTWCLVALLNNIDYTFKCSCFQYMFSVPFSKRQKATFWASFLHMFTNLKCCVITEFACYVWRCEDTFVIACDYHVQPIRWLL